MSLMNIRTLCLPTWIPMLCSSNITEHPTPVDSSNTQKTESTSLFAVQDITVPEKVQFETRNGGLVNVIVSEAV